MSEQPDEILTIDEVAVFLKAGKRTVYRLAASGERNSDIAKTLFLSPKTVERHVTNALRKVGARNRTELAALLADEGGGGQGEGFPR